MRAIRNLSWLIAICSLFVLLYSCNEPPAEKTQAAAKPAASKPADKPADKPIPTTEKLAGTLSIAGGTAHIPVMEEAQKVFAERYPELSISIAGGGSGVGIEQVGEGLVDIGNAGRTPTDEEIERYGLVLHRWAVDGVAVVVHPENPVSEMTKDQLKKVFAGEIANWQELGGPNEGINVYTRDEASGTRKVFVKIALDKGAFVDTANVVVSNGAMKTSVGQDPWGIGYVSVGHIDETVKPVGIDGVVPTLETVKSGEYKVSRGLFSLTKGKASGAAKTLIDFLYTPDGQKIIADKGFIPVEK